MVFVLRDFKILSIITLCGFIIFLIYYATLDNRFIYVEELHDFPVPLKAELVRETDSLKDYYWDPSRGDGIPFHYQLMIKKSGWQRVKNVDGLVYEKNGHYISYSPATDYFDISDYTKYWEADNGREN